MNKYRPLCLALFLFSLFSGPGHAAEQSASTLQETTLRESASNSAASVAELPAQAQVSIISRQGGWYEVKSSSGKQGWLPLLAVRFDSAANARSSSLSGLIQGSSPVAAGSGVATGVRGMTDEQLQAGNASGGSALQQLNSFSVAPADAAAYARAGDLHSQAINYAPGTR